MNCVLGVACSVVTITGSSANVPNAKRILLERVSAEVAAFRGASPPILAVPTPTVDS